MATIQETAYPRLKSVPSERDLADVYTPTAEELALATRSTKGMVARLGFLVTLKTFQRLGYFTVLAAVPPLIIEHIAHTSEIPLTHADLLGYDRSGSRTRHLAVIRTYLQVKPCGTEARHLIVQAMGEAARTKDEVADLVNVAIEELVRHRFELPVFATLERTARRVRASLYRTLYQTIFQKVDEATQQRVAALFVTDSLSHRSPWTELKRDTGRPTLTHLQELIDRLTWLDELQVDAACVADIADVKVKHFAAEAKSLDAARMLALEPHKRLTLAVALVIVQTARARDDLAEMLIKRMRRIHHKAKAALERYRLEHEQRTDDLVLTLRDVVVAYQSPGTVEERFGAVDGLLGRRSEQLLEACDAHLAHSSNHYFPFLWHPYTPYRAALLRLLQVITLRSSSQDKALESAIAFLKQHATSRRGWLSTIQVEQAGTPQEKKVPLVDLSWVPPAWWRLVTGQRTRDGHPEQVDRRQFEVCLFSQLMWELKSGDLYVEGGDAFGDYRTQLVSLEEYQTAVAEYGQVVSLPVETQAFVAHVRQVLETAARHTDEAFPENHLVRIEQGRPKLSRSPALPEPAGLELLDNLLAERLEAVNLLDVLADTEHWLNWTRCFGPLSGHDAKLADPIARYLTTVFCYGCNLGPTQTARAVGLLDRRQVMWIHQRHLTEAKLEEATRGIINAYNRFLLPKFWGSGKHASADGTKWDVYEQNLLAEYHIRYGGYGGIGYYHVSDTYIALFAHFIPCGVWEGIYLLDPLFKNPSDIQPDTLHADTQGQNEPIFGLAYLLGIHLMPRIRNWQELKFYRPTRHARYEHIDELFSDVIDWQLIATHLPDMLRVALSIQAGRMTASTILRRLGTYSRKNRLYQAFRELGRAVRTAFLLDYLADADLRDTIQAATNKSESFNGFTKWLFFGGEGVIAHNDREQQRKLIKYNHLVANCLIFYNVFAMSRLLHDLAQTGQTFSDEVLAALSPYRTHHINRFGRYHLDLTRQPPALDYEIPLAFLNTESNLTG